jgi:hypothetical protein
MSPTREASASTGRRLLGTTGSIAPVCKASRASGRWLEATRTHTVAKQTLLVLLDIRLPDIHGFDPRPTAEAVPEERARA